MSDETVIAKLEERVESHDKSINTLEEAVREIKNDQKAIYKIATSVELIAQRVSHIEEKVDDTNHKVDAQTKAWQDTERRLSEKISETDQRPYRRVFDNANSIKVAIITAICTGIVGGLIAALITFAK